MVYGMDVSAELNRAKHIAFNPESSSDVVLRSPREPRGLDLAEMKLSRAIQRARPPWRNSRWPISLVIRRGRTSSWLAWRSMQRDVPDAQHDFAETIRLSKDPRMLAWSHIYLGRIHDIQDERDQAVAEYQAALTVRDGQPDTRQAAEKGLKQPYAVPQQEHTEPAGDDDAAPDTQKPSPAGRHRSPAANPGN